MIDLDELARLDTREKLEERAEDLASSLISQTRDDIAGVYGQDSTQQMSDHVYGLAGLKASWMETLLIGKWIADARTEILAEIRRERGQR